MQNKSGVPVYLIMNVGIVLDGDVYQACGFPKLDKFRKKLKEMEKSGLNFSFFKLNQLEKKFLKEKSGNVPHISTSSGTFAFLT